jgi:hypothetical protein
MSPLPITLVGFFDAVFADEKAYHRLFNPIRTIGEWFRLDDSLSRFLGTLRLRDRKEFHRYRPHERTSNICSDCARSYKYNAPLVEAAHIVRIS